jgi:methylmalonyl-CoA carboxyltransferase 12S subunit
MKQTMTPNRIDGTDVAAAIDDLRQEVARLRERTAALELALSEKGRKPARESDNGSKAAALDEELIMVISAAIAAFLGVKPRIRQIVLLQSNPWLQQGRITIQASRDLSIHHG